MFHVLFSFEKKNEGEKWFAFHNNLAKSGEKTMSEEKEETLIAASASISLPGAFSRRHIHSSSERGRKDGRSYTRGGKKLTATVKTANGGVHLVSPPSLPPRVPKGKKKL